MRVNRARDLGLPQLLPADARQAGERDERPGAFHGGGRQVEARGEQRDQDQAGAREVDEQRQRPLGIELAQRRSGVGDQDDEDAEEPPGVCEADQNLRS